MKRVPVIALAVVLSGFFAATSDAREGEATSSGQCFDCHQEVGALYGGGKHSGVDCAVCHGRLGEHLADEKSRPETRMEHAVCGGCHAEQYRSLLAPSLASQAKVEKATFRGRSPLFDKLLAPHGFTKEHDEPRSHVFMVLDQFIVDRAFGGRFQLKDWIRITDAAASEKDVWGILKDAEPSTADQKRFLGQTATAANPVCLSCKSQDTILDWKYMGDADEKAKWSRGSKVVEMAREVKRPMACFACHDPHSAQPRVVRDALIEAVVDRGLGTYPASEAKSAKTTMKKIVFRDFRAIGILSRPDSVLMCAQCHVEYNCNPGTDPRTGTAVGMDDRRTNYFPWTNVLGLKARYQEIGFKDFKHAVTGALLTKIQHPETETYWGSRHEAKGVECKHCHMPREVGEDGKEYTYHGAMAARSMPKIACRNCHSMWSREDAEYRIEAIQNYTRGRMAKAEFWLGRLIDAYAQARDVGVADGILAKARDAHDTAHILWEWWTAENSDGFHNPQLARESLTQAVTVSQEAVTMLEAAVAEARKERQGK